MDLSELVGPHKLVGMALGNSNLDEIFVALDDKVFLFREDQNDGYRSNHAPVLSGAGSLFAFAENPNYVHRDVVARYVDSCSHGEADIIELIDAETGHTWLRVGTENIDDYYPSFVSVWTPMEAPTHD